MSSTTPSDPSLDDQSGQPSFMGFDYQILVTAWLALEFIVLRGATEILVEPPSQEDVAAELAGKEPPTEVSVQSFQIQIKLLSHALWSTASFKKLVEEKHKKGKPGPKPRERAFQYLAKDPTMHYLLVTTAGVDKGLNSHCISEIGATSSANGLSKLDVEPSIARRIGILASKTPENIRTEMRLLLQDHCQVPGDEVDECISKLEGAVRDRLAKLRPNVLSRAELQGLISSSRGELLSGVKPTLPENLEKIRQRLAKDHVVILIGPPGTGKSTIARLLVDEHRLGSPPAKHHTIQQPEDLKLIDESINGPHSHVYFVEDPWGQGKPDDKARFFTSKLAPLLRLARIGKNFIVVSRLAPYREAIDDHPEYPRWAIELDEKSYSADAYREIYERQLADWEKGARAKAMEVIDAALKHLLTPYAVTFFCGQLKDRAHKGWVSEQNAIKIAKDSNVHVFGKLLRERVTDVGRTEIIPAIAIWAYLTANRDFISEQAATELRSLLKKGKLEAVPDIARFFNFLTKSRWLQNREGGFVATPSVKEALQSFSGSHPADFEDTLTALIASWSEKKEFQSILLCVREAKWHESLVPPESAPPFDSYLVALAVESDSRNFIYTFRELADYSTTAHPVAELARALRTPRKNSGLRFNPMDYPQWTRRDLAPDLVEKIASDPECAICMEKFIVDHLTDGMSYNHFGDAYPREELLGFLKQFGWPLADWFGAALADVLSYPRESTPYLFECMLDLTPSDLDKLIDDGAFAAKNCHSGPSHAWEENWRQYSEGETDASRHDPDDEDPQPYFASKALASAIVRKNRQEGRDWITGHNHEAELFDAWATLITAEPDLEMRKAFVDLCGKFGETEKAARVVLQTPDPTFYRWAINALVASDFKIGSTAEYVLVGFARSTAFLELLQLEAGQRCDSALSLLGFLALRKNAEPDEQEPTPAAITDFFSGFEDLAALLGVGKQGPLIACLKAGRPMNAACIGETDHEFLSLLAAEWPEVPAIDVMDTLAANGRTSLPLLERFLNSHDCKIRVRAWALCDSRSRLLHEALLDPHFGCRNFALDQLSIDPNPEELSALLALVRDPSAFVRERLAEQIGLREIRAGIPALVGLLSDTRDYSDQSEYGDDRTFEVARMACTSLQKLAPIEQETLPLLISFLEGCESSSTDPLVHEKLFQILEQYPSLENIEFCSRFLDSIWLESKWNTLGGYGIVKCCINAVCAQLGHDPGLAINFDFSTLMQIAEWESDEVGLLAPALAALALGNNAISLDLTPVFVSDAFTEQRAQLLTCMSKRLRIGMPIDLKKHLFDGYSFLSFLQWADAEETKPFAEFSLVHPNFQSWLNPLENGDDFEQFLFGATNRLIASVDPEVSFTRT